MHSNSQRYHTTKACKYEANLANREWLCRISEVWLIHPCFPVLHFPRTSPVAVDGLSLWGGIQNEDPFIFAGPLDPSQPLLPLSLTPPAAVTAAGAPVTPLTAVFIHSGGHTWDNFNVLYLVSTSATGQLAAIYAHLPLPMESQLAATEFGDVAHLRLSVAEAAKAQNLIAPPPPTFPPPPPPIPPPPPPVSSPATGLVNCMTAVPGRLNM